MLSKDEVRNEFDHHSVTFARDAFAISDDLLERTPVSWSQAYGGFWVVASHELLTETFRNYDAFTSRYGASLPTSPFGSQVLPSSIDPPEHHVFRRYLNPWFQKETIKTFEPRIRETLRGVLAELVARGEWDFVRDVADVMPGTTILNLLGMPVERRKEFLDAMRRGVTLRGSKDPDDATRMAEDNEWIRGQLRLEIAARRQRREEDLLSYLVYEPVGGENLTDEQILNVAMLLLVAGFHTTSGAFAALLVHIARHPEQRADLQAHPEKIPAAIEEIVRIYTAASTMARTVVDDIEFGGVQMARGDKVLGLIMAANRDPKAFTDSATVDFDRNEKGSLAFGWGVHRCLGIHLARLILRVEVETVFEMMPDYEIDLDRVVLSDVFGMGYVHNSVPARIAG